MLTATCNWNSPILTPESSSLVAVEAGQQQEKAWLQWETAVMRENLPQLWKHMVDAFCWLSTAHKYVAAEVGGSILMHMHTISAIKPESGCGYAIGWSHIFYLSHGLQYTPTQPRSTRWVSQNNLLHMMCNKFNENRDQGLLHSIYV